MNHSGLLVIVAVLLAMLVDLAFGGHEAWPIVKERQLEEGTAKACIYHRVERCTGLRAPLPRLARAASYPCPHDPSRTCLPGTMVSGGYDPVHRTIILAVGNGEAYRHEAVHHLRWINFGDPVSHDGPEWVCQ